MSSTGFSPSAQRVLDALAHRTPDRIPIDLGATFVTGVHVSCVAALRRHYGLEPGPVKAIDPGQMLGEIGEDLVAATGVDTCAVRTRMTRFGFPAIDWKPWRMDDGLEVLVPGGFEVSEDADGNHLLYPQGDRNAPPSAVMPESGHFFDSVIRQEPIDEANLRPEDNLEEYRPISDADLAHLESMARQARATGRAVVASFGGTAFGDIALIPGVGLKHPKGIRDVTEWYISTRSRRDYIHKVFEGQCQMALANLERIAARLVPLVDVVNICGTDFGTQNSVFCSVATFRELWMPYYKAVNTWIHKNTPWKTFKHSCGAVSRFIPEFLDSGFDILNPVQCSATGMDPAELKAAFGERLVFWGGGVDTQQTLPFGTPSQVREQVLERCRHFAPGGGFVFAAVHNVQAGTPVENLVAMLDAVAEFNGH